MLASAAASALVLAGGAPAAACICRSRSARRCTWYALSAALLSRRSRCPWACISSGEPRRRLGPPPPPSAPPAASPPPSRAICWYAVRAAPCSPRTSTPYASSMSPRALASAAARAAAATPAAATMWRWSPHGRRSTCARTGAPATCERPCGTRCATAQTGTCVMHGGSASHGTCCSKAVRRAAAAPGARGTMKASTSVLPSAVGSVTDLLVMWPGTWSALPCSSCASRLLRKARNWGVRPPGGRASAVQRLRCAPARMFQSPHSRTVLYCRDSSANHACARVSSTSLTRRSAGPLLSGEPAGGL